VSMFILFNEKSYKLIFHKVMVVTFNFRCICVCLELLYLEVYGFQNFDFERTVQKVLCLSSRWIRIS